MNQDAVLWRKTGTNASGRPTYEAAVQIAGPSGEKVRWTDMAVEVIDQRGTTVVSSSVVFLPIDVEPGDVMMLGTTTDVVPGKAPLQHSGAYEVIRVRKTPNKRANKFLRKAYL